MLVSLSVVQLALFVLFAAHVIGTASLDPNPNPDPNPDPTPNPDPDPNPNPDQVPWAGSSVLSSTWRIMYWCRSMRR